ncbi:MAG: glycerol-3-phosphate 1-O-acyltransferase PlsY [Culicoidibacterales bacterium]
MTIFYSVLILTFAYLIGSIPTGLIIGKVFYQKNLHVEGSGATGTTNSMRVLGKKAALFVFIFDIIKALIPAGITLYFHLPVNIAIIAFATVLGHCFPIFAHFKGGKAVATSFGFFALFFPWPTTIGLLVFTISFILYDMISLSSMLAATTVFLITMTNQSETLMTKLFIGFIWLLLLYRHKDNIKRIIKKSENKIVISLKKKMIFAAISSIIVIFSSLFTLATPKDNASLKELFNSEINHLSQQKQYYESIAKENPTPKSYYNFYKAQVLHDAYTLISYDIRNTYTPNLQNDTSDRLIVDYYFASRVNLNANEADEVFEKYSLQYQTMSSPEKQLNLLEEMKTYLFQKLPASRTQRDPEKQISLQYLKVNNKWILPANEQINLTNYLNDHIFVNNFSTSYLGSDENALSQLITDTFKKNPLPDINESTSLSDFTTQYITYLKNQVFIELPFSIENSNKSTSESVETLYVTYVFNSKTKIPTKEITAYAQKKQLEIEQLPADQKEHAIKVVKQEIIDQFKKKHDTSLPIITQLVLPFSKAENSNDWVLSQDDFNRFKNYVNTQLISEI